MKLLREFFGNPLKQAQSAREGKISSPSPTNPPLLRSQAISIPRFCANCLSQTLDDSPGSTGTINLIGTMLLGRRDWCPVCGSVVQRMWFFFFLPIVPMSRYRVIYLKGGFFSATRYIGRRLPTAKDFRRLSDAERLRLNRLRNLISVSAVILAVGLLLLLLWFAAS